MTRRVHVAHRSLRKNWAQLCRAFREALGDIIIGEGPQTTPIGLLCIEQPELPM
jgi:hypothetical protein